MNDAGIRRETPTQKTGNFGFKLTQGMPLSAKNSSTSPIKILVSMGDTTSTRFKKIGGAKEHNKSIEKDLSSFLVKKPSAGLVNLKMGRNAIDTRGYSFDQDTKTTASIPLGAIKQRRNSSKGLEKIEKMEKNEKPREKSSSQKTKPYFTSELMSFSKRNNDLKSAGKPKIKTSAGFIGFGDTKETTKKGQSASKPKFTSTEVNGISIKTSSKISMGGGLLSPKKTDLSSVVTQVSEDDMNRLGGIYAEEPKQLTEEELKAEHNLMPKKLHKKDYLQANLPYYVGGVLVFFHEPKKDYFATLYKEHFRHTFASLKFCKGLVPATSAELSTKIRHYQSKVPNKHSKSLILDLDETLIHCVTAAGQPADIYLPIKFPNGDTVKVREADPGTDKHSAFRHKVLGTDVAAVRGHNLHGFKQLLR